ncbi:RpiB/LacA/LacB family sugar-phosphate isomerase [Aciditerrimonas ferrireducens]|uniref:RpiB/LacA/LacB family sugar-phosphate isomerase n=1 Tax=Aciditerrimonas ferrireducens TaxID=667306 RepID=UPI002003ED99|nr:RpiB/LacA/LacB family sugar-phosphate isomerase [Aciditerrimonas ferrireducens]MCK4177878.1 RpiB/LacA/LacB family sugar-phosphate isomerase [Aciditerrimonas ferrireducens]
MRVAFGTDERTPVSDAVAEGLRRRGLEVEELAVGEPWPLVGRRVGEAVAGGRAEMGVVLCHTGTGVAMAAGKVPGVRAALCVDAPTAAGARRWNDANVLALSLRLLTPTLAEEILDAFLRTDPDPEELPLVAAVEDPERLGSAEGR